MDINNNLDFFILHNANDYILIDESVYRYIINNINYNYLLMILTISCGGTLVCLYKHPKNDYVLLNAANLDTCDNNENILNKNSSTIKVSHTISDKV